MGSQLRLLFLCFAVFCFFSASTQADEELPPHFVYRADFREPQRIFARGMKSFGRNENLLQHVEGLSCSDSRSLTSAFVATTSSEPFARQFGADLLWAANNKNRYFYVYKIRATSKFYSAYNSLMNAYKQTRKKKYKETADFFKHEKEWVALKGIPANLIRSAAVYEKGKYRIALKEVRVDFNSRYNDAQTVGTRKYFPVKGTGVIGRVSLLATRLKVSSCFRSCPSQASDASDQSGQQDPSKTTCPIKSKVFETTITADTATVWDPLGRRAREQVVPWKEEVKMEENRYTEKPVDCTIDDGSVRDKDPALEINCPQNRFYEKFVVLLKAGKGRYTWVHMKHKTGQTGKPWRRSARKILVLGKGSLADEGYRIDEVFSATGSKKWWSKIRVLPVFPAYQK